MNRFTIKLFATLRERAHTAELTREFPDGTSVGDIWRQMVVEFPELGGHHDSVGFAVNQEYVQGDFKPRKGDEIVVAGQFVHCGTRAIPHSLKGSDRAASSIA